MLKNVDAIKLQDLSFFEKRKNKHKTKNMNYYKNKDKMKISSD